MPPPFAPPPLESRVGGGGGPWPPSWRGGAAAEAIQGAVPHVMGGRRGTARATVSARRRSRRSNPESTAEARPSWIASRSLTLALAMTVKDIWIASPAAPARARNDGERAHGGLPRNRLMPFGVCRGREARLDRSPPRRAPRVGSSS